MRRDAASTSNTSRMRRPIFIRLPATCSFAPRRLPANFACRCADFAGIAQTIVYLQRRRTRRGSQVVRQRSAKPPSSVRLRSAPPNTPQPTCGSGSVPAHPKLSGPDALGIKEIEPPRPAAGAHHIYGSDAGSFGPRYLKCSADAVRCQRALRAKHTLRGIFSAPLRATLIFFNESARIIASRTLPARRERYARRRPSSQSCSLPLMILPSMVLSKAEESVLRKKMLMVACKGKPAALEKSGRRPLPRGALS